MLDDLEERVMPKSFFDVSDPMPDDNYKMPAAMWEQAIEKVPTKNHMDRLKEMYPFSVIKKYGSSPYNNNNNNFLYLSFNKPHG